MKLKEYLKENRYTITDFAKKVGLSALTIIHVKQGKEPKFENALKIVNATNGDVNLEEIVPTIYELCVVEFLNKNKIFRGKDED